MENLTISHAFLIINNNVLVGHKLSQTVVYIKYIHLNFIVKRIR